MIMFGITVFLLFMSLAFHELCHGAAAYALGDETAKRAGRLTLNPLKHIDPFWTVLLPLLMYFSTGGRFMIGMAKPVPVDFSRFKNPRQGMAFTALAGPGANLLLAALFAAAYRSAAHPVLLYAAYLNLGLGFFNLIPLPPLDGSRVLAGILPAGLSRPYFELERYGFLLVLCLYLTGLLSRIVVLLMNLACGALGIPALT